MLDELFERILALVTEATSDTALPALESIGRLVEEHTTGGLIQLVRKAAARLASTLHDDELSLLIDAARADMLRLGIPERVLDAANDPLVRMAITTYCRANFGIENKNMPQYQQSYLSIVDAIRRSTPRSVSEAGGQ